MALGSNRDYKTSARRIKAQLERHAVRVAELVNLGVDPKEASKIAYAEIKGSNDPARMSFYSNLSGVR